MERRPPERTRDEGGAGPISSLSRKGRVLSSADLFGEADELLIEHDGEVYVLQRLPGGGLRLSRER